MGSLSGKYKNGNRLKVEAMAFIYDYKLGRIGTVSYRPNMN